MKLFPVENSKIKYLLKITSRTGVPGLNLWIYAECSNHLSYQGQTFAVPCF